MDKEAITEVPPHTPVMLAEVLNSLAPLEGTFLDATFGRGGYTQAILSNPKTKVIALDRDAEAITYGQAHFSESLKSERLTLYHARFSSIDAHIAPETLDGVVFDLGVSSPQFDLHQNVFGLGQYGSQDSFFHRWFINSRAYVRAL